MKKLLIFIIISASLFLISLTGKIDLLNTSVNAQCSSHWICGPPWYCGDCLPGNRCCWETRCCEACIGGVMLCRVSSEGGFGVCYFSCTPPCSCGSWSYVGGCGYGSCGDTERYQTRNCTPDACSSESRCIYDAACDTPTCTVSLDPAAASVAQGSDVSYTASVTIGNGSVDQVNFSSSDTGVATVNPASDATSPYQTVSSAVGVGDTIITADVVMSGATRCSDTANLEVTNPGPWWQVIDSDIVTNGDIISSIPLSCALPGCNPLLGLEGLGGFPGIPIYGGSLDTDAGGVSSTDWMANAESVFSKVYDYEYFSRLVRPDVTLTEIDSPSVNGGFFTSGGAPSRGYVWYHFDGDTYGDLVINSSVNMPGSRKVVVLVENADLYIQDRINVVDGVGYIMFIVGKDDTGGKGNIYVDPGVSHPSAIEIEGVFFAEGEFRTGAGNNQLHIRGMLAAMDGVVLERDLEGGNVDEPAEVFEYAPDFVLTFPRDLTFKRLKWKEVAP